MNVYVLVSTWDTEDGFNSDVIGVFASAEKARAVREESYKFDIESLGWITNENDPNDYEFKVERNDALITVYSEHDYRYITYCIYERIVEE